MVALVERDQGVGEEEVEARCYGEGDEEGREECGGCGGGHSWGCWGGRTGD